MQITNSVFQRHPANIVFHKNPKTTRKCLWDILPWVWYAQHNSYQVSYYQKRKISFNKLNKINPTHIQTSHFSNLNNNSKTKESMAINMKYFQKNRKPISFLEFWRRDDDENGRVLRETWWVCERDEQTRQWTVKVNEGKLKSFWNLSWKRPSLCKTHDFRDWNESQTSHQTKSQKNPWDNLKNLSKCFLGLEVPPARKSRKKPRNFLSKPRNWSFHSRTSCQTKSREI